MKSVAALIWKSWSIRAVCSQRQTLWLTVVQQPTVKVWNQTLPMVSISSVTLQCLKIWTLMFYQKYNWSVFIFFRNHKIITFPFVFLWHCKICATIIFLVINPSLLNYNTQSNLFLVRALKSPINGNCKYYVINSKN